MAKQAQVKVDEKKLETFTNVSTKIRYLDSIGLTRGAIAKKLGIRYQWVRNVLVTPVTQARESF